MVRPGVVAQSGEIRHAGREIVGHRDLLAIRRDPRFEGAGDRADASLDPFGKHPRKDVRELHGVIPPLGRAPIGRIDLFLHPLLVEAAIGKAVDRKRIEMIRREEVERLGAPFRIRQLLGRLGAEPKAKPEPLVWADPLLDGDRLFPHRGKVLLPAFARMDVLAVGEMELGLMLDDHAVCVERAWGENL